MIRLLLGLNTIMAEKPEFSQKVIIFLEHHADVLEYLEVKDKIPGIHIVIATIPDVCWELEKRGVSYRGIEQYYDSKAIYTTGMENYNTIENLCSNIDNILQESIPFLRKKIFKPALDNFYHIKKLFDSLSLRIIIIHTIIECENPSKMITFSSEKCSLNDQSIPFGFYESIYSIILDNNCWDTEIIQLERKNHNPIRKKLESDRNTSSNPSLIIGLYHLIKRFFISIQGKKSKFKPKPLSDCDCDFSIKNSFVDNHVLFLFRADPSWNAMLGELFHQGYHVVNLSERVEDLSGKIKIDFRLKNQIIEIIQHFCSHQDINVSNLLIKKILPILETYLWLAQEIEVSLNLKIDTHNPLAFLGSEKSFIFDHICAHIAHFRNIPVIAWQHGDGPFYPPMQIFVEVRDTNVHMSYGPGHQVMLRKAPQNHFNSQIESVGSLILEKTYLEYSDSTCKNKILYATTQYYYNHYYINCYPTPDNTLWHYQKSIINLLGNVDHPVIFKLMPQKYETPLFSEYIAEKGYNNISLIHYEHSFLDLLNDVDIVICDYPSTPVIEAIAAHKTIFVLLDSPYLREEALILLKKRVFWSDNIEEFVQLISDYLKGNPIKQNPDLDNTEYLETFGIHKVDGLVKERALKVIEKTIKFYRE